MRRLLLLIGSAVLVEVVIAGWLWWNYEVAYKAVTTIEVNPISPLRMMTGKSPQPKLPRQDYSSSQLSVISSAEVLRPVVNGPLHLRNKLIAGKELSEEEAIVEVQRRLDFSLSDEGRYIELGFWHPDADLAAAIANEVAEAYGRQQRTKEEKAYDEEFKAFEKVLLRLHREMEEAKAALGKLRAEQSVRDADPEKEGLPPGISADSAYGVAKTTYLTKKRENEVANTSLTYAGPVDDSFRNPYKLWAKAERPTERHVHRRAR